MFDLKLVAYEPNGARIGELPQPLSIEAGDPLSDVPALQVKYSKYSVGASVLSRPIEIALEIYNQRTNEWVEPVNSRYILLRTEGDRLDATGTMSYIAPGYSWQLNKIQIYPIAKSIIDGQISDAKGTEKSRSSTLNTREDQLAGSMGLSKTRPVTYATSAPSSTSHIWVDTTNTSAVRTKVYNDSTKTWELRATAGVNTAAANAYKAQQDHALSQSQLQDVQGRAKQTKRTFVGVHPGAIIATLLSEARTRGGRIPGMITNFTTKADSAGRAWPATNATIEINTGTSVLRLLQQFIESGQVDFRTNGRELQLYVQNTAMHRDLSATVALRYGVDLDEAPDKSTWENVAREILFLGESGLNFTKQNPEAPAPWGVWETTVSQSNVESRGTGELLAAKALEEAAGERIERTRGIILREASGPLPYLDFLPGDFILAPGKDGQMEPQRVHQITLTKEGEKGELAGNVVLHDRFLEREVRAQRTTEALIGGGSAGGTGGTRNPETYVDLRVPEAPRHLDLEAHTQAIKGGEYQSLIGTTWWWSRKATNGTEMGVEAATKFQVSYRLHQQGTSSLPGNSFAWRPGIEVDGASWEAVLGPVDTYNPVSQGPATYEVRVRVYATNGNVSAWSPTAFVTVPLDDVPPAKPSRPTASTDDSIINVSWNGLNEDGGQPPVDFHYVRVEEATIPPEAPIVLENGVPTLTDSYLKSLVWTLTDALDLTIPGTALVTRRPYKQLYAYRLVAVDLTGNESDPSEPSNIGWAEPTVDVEAIREEIDEAVATQYGNVQGEIDAKLDATKRELSTEPVVLSRLKTGELLLESAVAEEIWVRKLNTRKVLASEIILGSGPNLIANGFGEQKDLTNFRQFGLEFDPGENAGSGAALTFFTRSLTPVALDHRFPVVAGKKYKVSAFTRGQYVNQRAQVLVRYFTGSGSQGSESVAVPEQIINADRWYRMLGEIVAPEGATEAQLVLDGNRATGTRNSNQVHRWASVEVSEKIDANLIVDGTILGRHVKAEELEGGHLKVNSIKADRLDIADVRAKIVTSSMFQGGNFYGGLFEGSKFRTHNTDFRGIVMMAAGIRASDANQRRVFDIDAQTGRVMIAGRLLTGPGDGERNIIISSADTSWNRSDQGMWFTNDGTAYGWGSGAKKAVAGVFTLATASELSGDYPLNLRGHGPKGGIKVYSKIELAARDGATAMLHSDTAMSIRTTTLNLHSDNDMTLNVDGGRVIKFERNNSGYNASIGNSANMFMDSNGFIFKSSSSLKYKSNVTDHTVDESALDMPTLRWQDKWSVEAYDRLKDLPRPLSQNDQSDWDRIDLSWRVGSTAEAALEHGLDELVTYADGMPDGLGYDRYAFLLRPFVKELWEDYKARTGK